MVAISSSLQLSTSFPLTSPSVKAPSPKPSLSFTLRAADSQSPQPEPESSESGSDASGLDSFENRLSQVRVRYRSGTGKKAEVRKGKKPKQSSTSGSGAGSSLYLPPVPLKQPVSEGLKVDFGFSPYSERVNGRVAILGLSALLLVELATGKSVVNYHTPSIVFIQIYFVAAVTALYIKFEKERVSVWPR